MALVNGRIVALGDAKILADKTQHVDFTLLECTIGATNTKEKINHVVTGVVVSVDLNLRRNLVYGYFLLHKMLEHLKHLFAPFLAVVLQKESLYIVKFTFFNLSIDLHNGSDKHHEGYIYVSLCSIVAIGTAMVALTTFFPSTNLSIGGYNLTQ